MEALSGAESVDHISEPLHSTLKCVIKKKVGESSSDAHRYLKAISSALYVTHTLCKDELSRKSIFKEISH